ncbi:sensor histidine kinase [uncultured Chitinophaga sp.]|uniref:sensor histidine kinase n=1 Tax=uncultured Chitinophaga sp. TaxID=339340 RepID=UPI0025EEDE0D|nr:histidine kinase [uncultured Chitinophaga sp.]
MIKFRKIEFWVATALTLLLLFIALYNSEVRGIFTLQREYGWRFHEEGMIFDYHIHYLLPTLFLLAGRYLVFVGLGQWVAPKFLATGRYVIAILLAIGFAIALFSLTMVCYSYLDGWLLGVFRTVRGAHMHFAKKAFLNVSFLCVLYVVYVLLQTAYFQLFEERLRTNRDLRKKVIEIAVAVTAWVLIVIIFMQLSWYPIANYFLFMSPIFIVAYFHLQYRLLPRFYEGGRKKWPFFLEFLLVSAVIGSLCVLMMAAAGLLRSSSRAVTVVSITPILLLCILLPIVWVNYYNRLSQDKKVKNLQTALGKSDANLGFLRSQINPHFLFNALNTLYGTALQENASRTSEGIQKLGDMMRFMLHENNEAEIKLGKELAYLHNYISLQSLRVQQSPDIQIEVNIDEAYCDHYIAPMLLIPFVENAFKHGISLRNRSHISISLYCDSSKIYFDVHNTVHPRPDNDPERNSLGIGLNNVKQRLELMYPKKHELSIRQTATAFFVHLTIHVTK